MLKEFAKEADGFSEEDVHLFAKECLLSEDDVRKWLPNIWKSSRNAEKNKQTAKKTNPKSRAN